MKYCLWCLLLLSQLAWSQTGEEVRTAKNGNEYDGVAGNPYILKDWADGVVRFNNGRVMNQFKLKFDCSRNRLILQFDGASFPAEGNIKEFVIYTKSGKKKDSMVFRKGFPAIDRGTAETFYHIMLPGKATLLRLVSRNIVEEKDLLASNHRRFFEDEELFYLWKDGTMTHLPKDKGALLLKFPDNPGIVQYITAEQFRMKSPDDFLKIVGKYNELLALEQQNKE